MDSVSAAAELEDVRAEVEKLRAECRAKTKLLESLKKDRGEEIVKFQEATKLAEKHARELDRKSEEIQELRKIQEDLKCDLQEKEACIAHLSSENRKIQGNCAERLVTLEGSNRKMVVALDELTARNNDLEQNACASSGEISRLKALLLAAEEKCLEAEEKARQAVILRRREDVILQLEEENMSVQDKIKWRNEQFKHLEEAHEQLQVQFQKSKEEWEKEKSALLDEMSSLQTSLDSQTRTLEGLQSRLEMCNHALAHEESKRKLMEAEIRELKTCFDDVYSQCEEKKTEVQELTAMRNDEIASLRNSLGEKEMLVRELERKIVLLEQDNQELGDSVKELREAQIQNGGANSLTSKLRNKLRRLEETHKGCSSILKSKESQWDSQVAKMEADIIAYKSTLTNKEQEIRELQMELETCYHAIADNHMELLIFKSELAEAHSKSFTAETENAVRFKEKENMILFSTEQLRVKDNSLTTTVWQHLQLEEVVEQQKKMLEESSAGQLILKEQLLQMESTLQHERNAALEALERLKLEIANKNDELSRLDCEAQSWKSTAETLRGSYEEIQGSCEKMETSLQSQIENEQALKQENENLLCIVKDKDRKIEDLQRQISSLELCNAEIMKEAEKCKQEKDGLVQIALEKDCCIKDLQKDIAIADLKQESLKEKLEDAIVAKMDAEKALKKEKEILLKIKDENQTLKHFQKLATTMEHDLSDAMYFSFSNQVEKLVEVSALNEALKNAEYLTKLEIEEKTALKQEEENLLKIKDESQTLKHFQELATTLEHDLSDAMYFSFSNQVEKLVEVSALNEALKNAEYLTKLEIEEKNIRIARSELEIDNLKKKLEEAIMAQMDAEKALKQEEENLMKIKDKNQTLKHFQVLATTMEHDLSDAMYFSFSNQVEKLIEVSALNEALKNAEYLTKLEIEEKNMRIVKSELEINSLLDNLAHTKESFFHLKHEAEQLQTSLEAMKFETEKLTDKQQTMEYMITELNSEKESLLQDIKKLSGEREGMLAYIEDLCDRIGELSSGDMQLMERLGKILNTSVDENETAMDSVIGDHDCPRDNANSLLFPTTNKKFEESFGERSPLAEVNSLHM
ncbi:uncharacterized protein At4g38062-like [Lotus japonicus]|uniref:uncharacterized protein At4g38062-like n=1 Tax=Lotus japonicus TaxID=34305 RepID=UPI0025868813|nr:uncharacterized protein At4g38062-like [Lotus japonicus]XP_057430187.1 uncharacterized protein At4g38062-like [Lotus japonicus]XP_057430188.1 uncharacterized protein At4g38062-like [Lotus japonicus]XP_057430189.1 uncharacterized protein At4g38062-like [Lotus japonicus]